MNLHVNPSFSTYKVHYFFGLVFQTNKNSFVNPVVVELVMGAETQDVVGE